MNNKSFVETSQSSDNIVPPVAVAVEDEFRAMRKLKKTKKKLKKCKKLYRLAKSGKKGSRKKYKKKLRKNEMRIRELEHELEILRIRLACEERFYQLLYQSPQAQQMLQSQGLLGSQPYLQLPDLTKGKGK